ncbi:hypothetical protein J6590_008719 [Homalodisca vitripennis]|nr:hypothetical protein J6590_008719 [Homalodisca vitripennis]
MTIQYKGFSISLDRQRASELNTAVGGRCTSAQLNSARPFIIVIVCCSQTCFAVANRLSVKTIFVFNAVSGLDNVVQRATCPRRRSTPITDLRGEHHHQ